MLDIANELETNTYDDMRLILVLSVSCKSPIRAGVLTYVRTCIRVCVCVYVCVCARVCVGRGCWC